MFVVLAGGVGAARFLSGLVQVVPPEQVTVIVNTGDDLEQFGLSISPDIDSVVYTLGGLADPVRGWGIAGDTFHCLSSLEQLGQITWFGLGDRDLATHLVRSDSLRAGLRLSAVTRSMANRFEIPCTILPMTDDRVRTKVLTDQGEIPFQEYFVLLRQEPEVRAIRLDGAEYAKPCPGALEAIAGAEAIIIAPSNPFVSIGTILSIPGYREAIQATTAPVAAISPIIGGKALKGPADKMMRTLGHEPSALGVARIYRDLIDIFVLDLVDAELALAIEALKMRAVVTNTIMRGADERAALARTVVEAVR